MANQMKGLGKGLGALLGDNVLSADERSSLLLPISQVESCSTQPRKAFDPDALADLSESIRQHGIIQPLTVRKLQSGYYQIIAGERRWRAARMAGLSEIPVVVIEADDKKAMELALIENLQRADLNPIEEAQGYQQLMTDYGMTQELAAERVGKSRPAVANALRLLSLCPAVLELVEQGRLSAGHARALLAIKSAPEQYAVAMKVINLQLSVRQTENMCKNLTRKPKQEQPKPIAVDYIAECEKTLSKRLSRGVRIVNGKRKGRVELEYYGEEDLQQLYELLERLGERRSGRYE